MKDDAEEDPAVSSKVRRSSQTFLFELKSGMEYLRNIFHDNSELQDPPLPSLGTTKTQIFKIPKYKYITTYMGKNIADQRYSYRQYIIQHCLDYAIFRTGCLQIIHYFRFRSKHSQT